MGTGGPPVTVRAATLAGGEKNQDRYASGEGWAFVLDGASSFATEQPEHDGGWYAERLKIALVDELTAHPDDATTDIVAKAIEVAASAHENPVSCPTSTIAMARWGIGNVEVYVLGDSSAVLIGGDGEREVTDSRLGAIAPGTRAEYRSRLASGHGFDENHRQILERLQAQQAQSRNRDDGYWVAGADPDAASHGQMIQRPLATIEAVVLATDGAAAALKYGLVESWTALVGADPHQLLSATHSTEKSDPLGTHWPRSKVHDDKTVQVVAF